MAKGSGSTRYSGASGSGGGSYVNGATYTGFDWARDAATASNQQVLMQNSLKKLAGEKGWSGVSTNSISHEVADTTNNVRNYSISVSIDSSNGNMTLAYETRLTGWKSPLTTSKDFDKFQREVANGGAKTYNNLSDAYKGLMEQVKKLNKMKIS